MSLEWLNILSVAGFSFLLLILLIGYFFVEVVIGQWYRTHFFAKYENHLFDRVLHYIFCGIIVHIVAVVLITKTPGLTNNVLGLFNNAGQLSSALGFEKANVWGESQIIIFSIMYFAILTFWLTVSALLWRIGYFFFWIWESLPTLFVAAKGYLKLRKKRK